MKSFCQIYAQWDQVGDSITEDAQHLLDLGLVCDTTFGLEQGKRHRETLLAIQAVGGLCAPNIYPATCDPTCRDSNWWKYSTEECIRLLRIAQDEYMKFGLGPMVAVNTYTPGNPFVAACREMGVQYLLGFCAPIVIEDGGWEIAHYASPLSPYFIGEEDYRKPESPGTRSDSVLMSSMELRNPLVCMNHWSEGPWCPLNAQAADRWLEPSGYPLPFLAIAEDWLRQAELSGRPGFFHLNLQYFFAGRCREHNRRALEWLAQQRDLGRLEIGGLRQWSEHLKTHGGFERQTTYWRGEMMGFHVGHRPGCFPDVVVDESLDHQGIWQKPDPLPKRFYDYTSKWDYPAFQPTGEAPASENFSDISVHIRPDGAVTDVRISNRASVQHVPIVLWNALEGWEAPFTIQGAPPGWTSRIIPHPAGAGAAVLLEGLAAAGETAFLITAAGAKPAKCAFSRSWPDLVEAQTFFHQGRPYTVLAAQTPEPFIVQIELIQPATRPILHESLCGIDYERKELTGPEIMAKFDGRRLACWHRFWDVTADQITLKGVDAIRKELRDRTSQALVGTGLQADAPGYQIFGDIRNAARWDRKLARLAGEEEMRRCREWLCSELAANREIVVEAHPGLYLPRGSITKVLGHEFDEISCAAGYAFRELCVDYPQGWDWGVSAWVQWRSLRLEVKGLMPGDDYSLHLHAFDPEERDVVQRVHFFNPAQGRSGLEICAVREWVLPRGVAGRWEPSAICSVRIPEQCLQWPSLGIWIVPLEKEKLHDWVQEKGSPGVLSHLWVSKAIAQTHP